MKKRGADILWITIASVLGLVWGATVLAADEVRVWPTASVDGDSVRLADIAEIKCAETTAAERLAAINVAPAPSPGGETLVRSEQVRRALAAAGVNMADTAVRGASRCKVSRSRDSRVAEPPGPEPKDPPKIPDRPHVGSTKQNRHRAAPSRRTLEYHIRRHILSRAPDHPGRLEIIFAPADRPTLALSEPEFRFDLRPAPATGRRRTGPARYEIDIVKDNARVETVTLVAALAWHRDVVVARRAINVGETIDPRHVRIESRRFDDPSRPAIADLGDVIGMKAKRFVPARQMLPHDAVGLRPVVGRGDAVTIWHRGSGLIIKTTGRVLEDGAVGDRVRVRRDGTRRRRDVIEVVVTGPGAVELANVTRMASR